MVIRLNNHSSFYAMFVGVNECADILYNMLGIFCSIHTHTLFFLGFRKSMTVYLTRKRIIYGFFFSRIIFQTQSSPSWKNVHSYWQEVLQHLCQHTVADQL